MLSQSAVMNLESSRAFFDASTHGLTEEDSQFRPTAEMYTVAQQVAHTAHAIDCFAKGAFSETGPAWSDEVMAEHEALLQKTTSLDEARAMLARAFDSAVTLFTDRSDEEMMVIMPDESVMAGAPRMAVISGIRDHTAHHRGSLVVYARLLGRTPAMPYMPPADHA